MSQLLMTLIVAAEVLQFNEHLGNGDWSIFQTTPSGQSTQSLDPHQYQKLKPKPLW